MGFSMSDGQCRCDVRKTSTVFFFRIFRAQVVIGGFGYVYDSFLDHSIFWTLKNTIWPLIMATRYEMPV